MINREEIDTVARDLEVGAADVERDYVFGWLLATIYTNSSLGRRLVLKGGNALRKGYFPNTRYSGDLDFATSGGLDTDELHRELTTVCDAVSKASGVTFYNDRAVVREKPRIDRDLQVLEARLYFQDFYGKPGHVTVKVRMDVTQFERLLLPPATRPLIHAYSDASACQSSITCVKLEEILASKLKCLLQRRHVADLFDYVHWLVVNPEGVDVKLVLQTFLHKTIYGRQPGAALELLLGLPYHALRDYWTKFVVCPSASLIAFEDAVARFIGHLRQLFAPHEPPTDRSWWSRRIFFPSELRNVILEAGSRMTLVRMKYKGVERLVEPYSLRYRQTKESGAREYFFGYDQSGGRSRAVSIKTFVADQFESAEVTDIPFEPQWDVEVSKAGDIEQAGRFVRRRTIPGFGLTRRRAIPGPTYLFRCPACGRLLTTGRFDSVLRPHTRGGGVVCGNRTGVYVRTRW